MQPQNAMPCMLLFFITSLPIPFSPRFLPQHQTSTPLYLLRKHHAEHTQKPLSQPGQLLHNGLHRLPRRPPQMILPPNPPFPLGRNRIRHRVAILFLLGVLIPAVKRLAVAQLRHIRLVEPEIAAAERVAAGRRAKRSGRLLGGHLLARLVLVPFLAGLLPLDQGIDLGDGGGFVDGRHVDGALEEGVHVQFAGAGPVAQELEDALQPAHDLGEETVVVDVDLVDEFVEVVLVARAEVDEGLHRLVRVGGDVLALRLGQHGEHVVGEGGEVADAAVDVGRFVDAHEGLVEDGEEVAEELERDGLFDEREHACFVTLAGIHFEELLEVCEERGPGFHAIVGILDGVDPGYVGVENGANLGGAQFRGDLFGAEDGDYEVDIISGSRSADTVLKVFRGINKDSELFAENWIIDLDCHGVNRLLE